MTRLLPVTLPSVAGESWDSYLTRTAAANQTNLHALAGRAGLLPHGRWAAYYGVVIDDARQANATEALAVDAQTIHAMHLSAYGATAVQLGRLAVDPSAAVARSAARAGWVSYAGSRFCPDCLAADGVWQLAWRLPWTTCCTTHATVLAHRCPGCGMLPRSGRGVATTCPVRGHEQSDPRRCSQALPGGYGDTCLADLVETPVRRASRAELALAVQLQTLPVRGSGVVAGQVWPAWDCYGAWQRAACYAAALGCDPLRGTAWSPARPWLSPPRAPADMLTVLAVAAELVTADSPATAAGVLDRWCARAGVRPTPATFRDVAPQGPAMASVLAVLLAHSGRSHSRINRTLDELDGQYRFALHDLRTQDIPQLVWPCALPEQLRALTRPGQDLLRAVLALTLARIAGATSWAQAAVVLGWPPQRGVQWSRYVFAARNGALRGSLITTAMNLAAVLPGQPAGTRWGQRPPTGRAGNTDLRAAQRATCHADTADGWCPCQAPATTGTTAHTIGITGREAPAVPGSQVR